ncbi:g2727 [Coccomyxa viridis]|uniref:G2727 protein n=1 Tax=Coccomyxa viridis TaxID=1274662 RepID=A0ABP1FNE9_9CHLO
MATACIRLRPSLFHTVSRSPFRQASEANIRTRGFRHSTRAMSLSKESLDGLPAYVGGPANRPAVIVLQEWWGVTDEIKGQAEHLSKLNDVRVAVLDLYKGKIGVDAEEASHLMENLDFKQAVSEITAAAKWLREKGAPKVGVTGFCVGGALSFLGAEYAGLDAAAPFYGTPPAELGHPEKISIPVQAHVGEDDAFEGFADAKTVRAFVDKIVAAGNSNATLYTYPGEGHAFMNNGNHEDIRKKMETGGLPIGKKESQDKAWERVSAFFKEHLG